MNTEQSEARIKEEQEAKDRVKRAQAKLWAKQAVTGGTYWE